MRAHFNRPLTDRMGNQIDEAVVRLLVAGSTTELISDTIYSASTGGLTRTNPWTITNGEIDFFLEAPARLQIGVKVGTFPEEFWDNVDVLAVATESTHPGTGAASTAIGSGASATGAGSMALGAGTLADADSATVIGYQASAAQAGATAIGAQASASEAGALAVGQSSLAQGLQATALGGGAQSTWDQATAVGAGAQTTRPNQVAIGTVADLVDIPGSVVLHSPDGTPFVLAVTDDGRLYTQKLAPYVQSEPPAEGGG
ncbi:hypothetical protein OG497_37425 [Streptomyces sp. NBC_01242]|uniref:hypothetical protein n=1 Tax=Streptomyces sp. NBC_01242 TaxID=2903795 RepID=UPI002253DE1C|nr:hypothetical protein [Streptomyces sp. NBC_01242]MCX4799540.1 hypothetical protein [Streptomyces sp. NBC_01242]